MKLLISVIIHIAQKVRSRPPKRRVPPLISNGLDTLIFGMMRMAPTRRELNELLNPIKKNRSCQHKKCILPIQRTFNKYRKKNTQNTKRKEMPPDELQRFLRLIPSILNAIHFSLPLHSFILTQLSLRKPMKNNICFKKKDCLCP
jgi:hypothetical protein